MSEYVGTKGIMNTKMAVMKALVDSLTDEQRAMLYQIDVLESTEREFAIVEAPVGAVITTEDESETIKVTEEVEGKKNLTVNTLLGIKDENGEIDPIAMNMVGEWEELRAKYPKLNGTGTGKKITTKYVADGYQVTREIVKKYWEEVNKCIEFHKRKGNGSPAAPQE